MNNVIREQPGAQPMDGVEVEIITTEEDFDVTDGCFYVVSKDKNVTFYSNNIMGQPSKTGNGSSG